MNPKSTFEKVLEYNYVASLLAMANDIMPEPLDYLKEQLRDITEVVLAAGSQDLEDLFVDYTELKRPKLNK